ncbi:MAG: hypothetical protein DRQ49_15810 [Gammaproteobacteria bacterium]|nr:MAG: hypothetical protein DRQ49_15810 [Gammaproteobacteria bacterium]RKZ74546.1 MAG: hypothetical protein DRQ57_10715 [Gammaproteobacteria bacterium]
MMKQPHNNNRIVAILGCALLATSWNVVRSDEPEPVLISAAPPSCDNIRDYLDCTSEGRQEDIVFVFDTTGSMGEEIAEMRHAVIEFAETIADAGIDYRLGLTEYKDFPTAPCGESGDMPYQVYNEGVLTSDQNEMKGWVEGLEAAGGNDIPESLLAALDHTVTDQQWRPDAHRIAIIITDAPPHIDDDPCHEEGNTLDGIITTLQLAGVVTHVIGPDKEYLEYIMNQTNLVFESDAVLRIANKTGGSFFDIDEIRTGKKNLTDILGTIAEQISCTYHIHAAFGYQDGELNINTRLNGAGGNALPHIDGETQLTVTACRQDGSICDDYELTPETVGAKTNYKHTADASAFSDPAELTDFSTLVKVCDFATTTQATLHIGDCVAGVTPAPSEPVLEALVEGINAEVSWATDPFARGYTLLYAPYSCPMSEVTLNNVAAIPLGLQTKLGSPLASGTELYVAVQAANCSGPSPIAVDVEDCGGSSSLGEVHIP